MCALNTKPVEICSACKGKTTDDEMVECDECGAGLCLDCYREGAPHDCDTDEGINHDDA